MILHTYGNFEQLNDGKKKKKKNTKEKCIVYVIEKSIK
jgi:hypothetical protein